MNIDLEKLRNELKNKIDEVINSYLTNNNIVTDNDNSNALVDIKDENIYMEFELNGHYYVVFSEDPYETEEMKMMFAKVENIDGNEILRNIENYEEYQTVLNEFSRRLQFISD